MDRGKRRRGGHSIPGPNRGNKDSKVSLRPQKVANKAANDIQITAEQILKEAQAHRVQEIKPPTDGIRDEKEMQEYKLLQRNMWENKVRRQRHHIGHWIKYIMWEESMSEFTRARSLFERALEVEYQNVSLWLKYAEMEMRHKFINHARNVWERACTLLPRVDQFWYKYAYMEEVLGNYKRAHQIFEKWMNWRPDENAWMAFVKFQERINQPEECRKIMYRYLDAYPTLEVYLKVIRFEIQHKNFESARKLFEQVVDDLGEEALQSKYFIEFARFETRAKEIQRAREIYHFGLANLPVESSQRLYEEYLGFEKQYGQKEEIDLVIVEKRRKMYCSILEKNKLNYDIWFDLIYLEMNCEDNKDKTRATFEEAILNLPPVQEKRYWRRFIYFWINYAVFEELDCQDMPRAKSVYERVLKLIPHSVFTFTKVWILFAHFLLRAHDLPGARKVMGLAIAKCPSEKIFNEYVNIELQLTEVERCRSILVKFVKTFPDNPNSWIKFAEFEAGLEEYERAEAIFENAIQIQKEMPELVWKGYIDMQISRNEYQSVRSLYSRLLERTKHVKVPHIHSSFSLLLFFLTSIVASHLCVSLFIGVF